MHSSQTETWMKFGKAPSEQRQQGHKPVRFRPVCQFYYIDSGSAPAKALCLLLSYSPQVWKLVPELPSVCTALLSHTRCCNHSKFLQAPNQGFLFNSCVPTTDREARYKMVIIGGEKYACERCIRGHRVSSCTHEDAPLTHIKPKGRPASQCQHCRDARKTGGGHYKCKCGQGKGNCQCQVSLKCDCGSKAKARPVQVATNLQSTATIPHISDPGAEIELGTINDNARTSPFQTWYPRTADAYNALPSVTPTFGFEDDTAPVKHAEEFIATKTPGTTEVWYAKIARGLEPRSESHVPKEIWFKDRTSEPNNPNSWY